MAKIALVSGGIDSITAALLAGTDDAVPLFFDYGQNARVRELECAEALAGRFFEKKMIRIDLPWYREFVSPPLCVDEEAVRRPLGQNRGIAYAPFRNSLFIVIAAAVAEANGLRQVVTGSHGTDTVYPDNSPEYAKAMNGLLSTASMAETIELVTPVMAMDKVEIIRAAQALGVPFELTWGCYSSNDKPCRSCLSCNDRARSFKAAGIADPLG